MRDALRWCAVTGGVLVSGAFAVLVLLPLLPGDGITVPPGGDELPGCAVTGRLDVSDLAAERLRGCDLAGVEVVFPDGYVLSVAPVGNAQTSRTSDTHYHLDNWGVPGTAAAVVTQSGVQVWGPLEAVRHELQVLERSYPVDRREAPGHTSVDQ